MMMMMMKIRQVRAELFHADGQTDRHDELIVAFRNFPKAPKKIALCDTFCVSVRAYVIYTYYGLALPLVPLGRDCILICE